MRVLNTSLKRERGFLLIVAVVVLVVIAVAIAALGNMTSADIRASTGHAQGEQAYFAAASGIEYASQQFGSGTRCSGLSNTNIAVGAGTFATGGVLYAPPRTNLAAAITAASTTIPVASIAGYAPRGQVRIDSEYVDYASTSAVAAACNPAAPPCLLNAKRGTAGSAAAAHAIATPVAQGMCVVTATGVAGGTTRVIQRGIRLPGAMFVYAKLNGDRVPYYRRWDGSAWGAEGTATNIGGAGNIEFVVLKFARTRDEAILGVQDSNGAITVQIWNGSVWSAATAIGTAAASYRGFDIEYERNSDRAIIAYHTGVAAQFSYRTWNGSTLSGPANVALPAGFLTLRWIELASNPLSTSNDLAIVMTNSAAAGAGRIYGMRWTGSAWNNMGAAAAWYTTAASTATKIIDVAYEQTSGDILFIWADQTINRTQLYRTYSGGILSGNNTLTIAALGGRPAWVRLAPDPASDRIMYGATDGSNHLDTRQWSGAAWDAPHTELSAAVQNITERVFDIAFESHPSNAGIAWAVWGAGNVVNRSRWNSATSTWTAAVPPTDGQQTGYISLLAHPFKDSGAVFAGLYEAAGSSQDIETAQLTGGSSVWSTPQTPIWLGTTLAPAQERMFVGAERALSMIYALEIQP